MNYIPPPPPEGVFDNANLHCTLSDIILELLSELDKDVIAQIANTNIGIDLGHIDSAYHLINGGRLDIAINTSEYKGTPCYALSADLSIKSLNNNNSTSLQLHALVSTHLHTLFEKQTITFDQSHKRVRLVWGLNLLLPPTPKSDLNSTTDDIDIQLIPGDQANNQFPQTPDLTHSLLPHDGSTEIASSENETDKGYSKPRYIVQQSEIEVHSETNSVDEHTCIIDSDKCPGLLFSGSELVFMFLVALHAQSTTMSSLPEEFAANVFRDINTITSQVFTPLPKQSYILQGSVHDLVGVRLNRPDTNTPHDPTSTLFVVSILGHMSQWYFQSSSSSRLPEPKHTSGISDLAGMELVMATRIAGVPDLVSFPAIHSQSSNIPFELWSTFHDFVGHEESNLNSFLLDRKDVTALLTDFIRTLVLKKPGDVYQFAVEYFGAGAGL